MGLRGGVGIWGEGMGLIYIIGGGARNGRGMRGRRLCSRW